MASKKIEDFAIGNGKGQLGPYWEPGRKLVDNLYAGIEKSMSKEFVDVIRYQYPSAAEPSLAISLVEKDMR